MIALVARYIWHELPTTCIPVRYCTGVLNCAGGVVQVSEDAVKLLWQLLCATDMRADLHRALCAAICSARVYQPLLAFLRMTPYHQQQNSSQSQSNTASAAVPAPAASKQATTKGLEIVRLLVASGPAAARALVSASCSATMLAVVRREPQDSRSSRTAIACLHDLAAFDTSVR